MLGDYGWNDALQRQFDLSDYNYLTPARVLEQQRGRYRLVTQLGEAYAALSGKLAHEAAAGGYPVAGDWVAAELREAEHAATIHAVLPRTSVFRRARDHGGMQVIAANIDTAFLVASLNGDLNLRRLERYLAIARDSGAAIAIVLTKADACADADALKAEVEAIAAVAPVHVVSALTGAGLDALSPYLAPGRTAALLGSSGVGKSTLVNALAGAELMATQAISGDDKRGRHTTSHRELILLPSGGLLLDSPGMRAIGLADADEGFSVTFEDVEAIAARCRFRDCGHNAEPGCAIRAALKSGELDSGRWRGFEKLQRELAFERRKDDPLLRAETRKVWIQRTRHLRAHKKARDTDD